MIEDIFQNNRISRNNDLANSARESSQNSERNVIKLEKKVENLLIVTEALWTIIKKSHKLEDSDLEKLIEKIDLKDGRLDGRVAKTGPVKCQNCGKTVQNGNVKCMYCGTKSTKGVFQR